MKYDLNMHGFRRTAFEHPRPAIPDESARQQCGTCTLCSDSCPHYCDADCGSTCTTKCQIACVCSPVTAVMHDASYDADNRPILNATWNAANFPRVAVVAF